MAIRTNIVATVGDNAGQIGLGKHCMARSAFFLLIHDDDIKIRNTQGLSGFIVFTLLANLSVVRAKRWFSDLQTIRFMRCCCPNFSRRETLSLFDSNYFLSFLELREALAFNILEAIIELSF